MLQDECSSLIFLCLQENNAIAVLDLASERIEDIFPLGYKSWENSRLDASNKDNGKTKYKCKL